jgi:hypothetical protein
MTKREKKTKAARAADKTPVTFEQQKAARATAALNAPPSGAPQK